MPKLKIKPIVLAIGHACYAIGRQWRIANGLPGDPS